MSNIYMTMRTEHTVGQTHTGNPYYRRSEKQFLHYIRITSRK